MRAPFGSEVVATLSGNGGPIVIVRGCVPEAPVESVILIVKFEFVCAPGVPDIVTEFVLLAPRDRPVVSDPEMDHVKGATPPVALTVAVYGLPQLPAGRDVVVITGAPSTVIESVANSLGYVTDVALTVSGTDVPGATVGALYVADDVVTAVRVPCAGSVQLTPAPDVSLSTLAVIACVPPLPIVIGPFGFSMT